MVAKVPAWLGIDSTLTSSLGIMEGMLKLCLFFFKKRTGVRGVQVSGIVFASNCLARDRDLKYLGVLSLVLPMLPVFLFVFLYMFYGFPFLISVHIVFWLRNLIN